MAFFMVIFLALSLLQARTLVAMLFTNDE